MGIKCRNFLCIMHLLGNSTKHCCERHFDDTEGVKNCPTRKRYNRIMKNHHELLEDKFREERDKYRKE